ncbi:putative kelch-type beta propeller [Helianthus annuus]|uniref:Kelch-type beta propeller n=2 Tax=Helianthus annuus TaxID=4232 RepID=A0A9K3J726_HELAN|nr:putative kelch-type beta propeller [Helianthus annuus]
MFPALTGGQDAPATAKAPPLLAVVKNELYAAYYEEQEVRKYDKGRNVWVRLGGLPERAGSMNGRGLTFRACGDQLIVIAGPQVSYEGMIELNSWVPDENPTQWNLIGGKRSGGFVYNCAMMGC